MADKNEEARDGESRTSENASDGNGSDAVLVRRPSSGNPAVIGYVAKNSRERIRLALDDYHGRCYLDVRIVVQAEDGSDKPTKAGVTIRPDRIGDLRRLIEIAEAAAERLGMLDV